VLETVALDVTHSLTPYIMLQIFNEHFLYYKALRNKIDMTPAQMEFTEM